MLHQNHGRKSTKKITTRTTKAAVMKETLSADATRDSGCQAFEMSE